MPVIERKYSRHSGGANKDYLETILDVSLDYLQNPSNKTFDVQVVKQEFPVDFSMKLPAEGDVTEQVTGGIILNDAWFNYDPTELYFENYTKEQIQALSAAEQSRLTLTPRYRVLLDSTMPYPAGGGGGKLTFTPYINYLNATTAQVINAMWTSPPFTASANGFTGEFLYSVYNNPLDDFPEIGDDGSLYANFVMRFRCQFYTGNVPTAKYNASAGETEIRNLFPNANNY
jgi:hypothetical protein